MCDVLCVMCYVYVLCHLRGVCVWSVFGLFLGVSLGLVSGFIIGSLFFSIPLSLSLSLCIGIDCEMTNSFAFIHFLQI